MDWRLAICSTDTVYGLLAHFEDKEAVDMLYELKGRDRSKPLILFGASVKDLMPYVNGWNSEIDSLANKYWPGPLTIIAKRSKQIPNWLNPGFDSIGLRIPASKSAKKLLEKAPGRVLLSTSANFSSEPSITNYEKAVELFQGKVDLILEPEKDEKCLGLESTIIKLGSEESDKAFKVLRKGVISFDQVV